MTGVQEEASPGQALAVVVMGVAGSGKSTVAKALAARVGAVFLEGDDFHPPRNVTLMAAGTPLSDHDREEWLESIGCAMARNVAEGRITIVSCSALKRKYRDTLRRYDRHMIFLFLDVDRETAVARMIGRANHFMPVKLAGSQFRSLERPDESERSLRVDGRLPLDAVLDCAAEFVLRQVQHQTSARLSLNGSKEID